MPKSKHDPNHTDDILCVCTCGGNTLATGGYDGAIVLWHFDSRNSHLKMWPSPTYESQMSPNMRAVEQVSWLPKKNVLVSCGSDGYLRFWNINTGKLFMQKYAHHKRGEAILSLVVDQEEEYIFTGDAAGSVEHEDLMKSSNISVSLEFLFLHAVSRVDIWMQVSESLGYLEFFDGRSQ